MHYLVKVKFQEEQDNGKIKTIREQWLVAADSVSKAEKLASDKIGKGISSFAIEAVIESKILGYIE